MFGSCKILAVFTESVKILHLSHSRTPLTSQQGNKTKFGLSNCTLPDLAV